MYAVEAVISKLCHECDVNAMNYRHRREARELLDKKIKTGEYVGPIAHRIKEVKMLERLRNCLAHGQPDRDPQIGRIVHNPAELPEKLHQLFETVLGNPAKPWPW